MEKFDFEKYGVSELTTDEKQDVDAGCLITLTILYELLISPLTFFVNGPIALVLGAM